MYKSKLFANWMEHAHCRLATLVRLLAGVHKKRVVPGLDFGDHYGQYNAYLLAFDVSATD